MAQTDTAAKKPASTPTPAKSTRGRRARPGATSEVILDAAELVFSRSGYAGATVERIAKQAKCYESLIYYHFGSKDKLFAAVLQNAYRKLIEAEQRLVLDFTQPEQALSDIIRFLWQYYQDHPELIILLNTENLLKGQHMAKLRSVSEYLAPAIAILQRTVESGIEQGVFRPDIDVVDLYISIMGLSYFYLSNRYTLSAFLDKNLMDEAERLHWSQVILDTIFASVRAR